MDKPLRALVQQTFADSRELPAAVAEYVKGTIADVTLVEQVLAVVLQRYQDSLADSRNLAAERLRSEEQMENLTELLGTILDSSDEGIVALDPADRIVRFNKQFVSIFCIPDEVMAFWHHNEMMAALLAQLTDPDAFQRDLAVLCADAKMAWREILLCKDGRVIEWRSMPQPGVWAGVKRVLSFIDVTERFQAEANRRLLERELDKAQNRLLQAEKLAAIFQLSAGLAHEISNPIGFIHSNLETLRKYVSGMVELLQCYRNAEVSWVVGHPLQQQIEALKKKLDLDFIQTDTMDLLSESMEGTQRLSKMVSGLRVLAHAQGGSTSVADLRQAVELALAQVRHVAGERVQLLPLLADMPDVECRLSELVEVFKSLLTNAIEAIEGKGSVTIKTGANDNGAWVEVVDSGRGISPDNIARIFDPFFTTKPPGAGMGLGLSVAYAIVTMHGGTITASSQIDQGSSFLVTLPFRHQG